MSKRPESATFDELILAAIRADPAVTDQGLAKQLGCARGTITKHLQRLVKTKRLRQRGYYAVASAKASQKIFMYVLIKCQAAHDRVKVLEVLRANTAHFPFVSVTDPFDFIAFVGQAVPPAQTEAFLLKLAERNATTQTSVVVGEPALTSPELPLPEPGSSTARQL